MTSAPQLLTEDRPDFERVLDTALHTAGYRTGESALSGVAEPLNMEQLRTMALSAVSAICACASEEYTRYVRLREELRRPTSRSDGEGEGGSGGGVGLGTVMGNMAAESGGAGLAAVVAVLAPVLAGTAAVIFLLVGYALHMLTPEPAAAAPLRAAGWVFAALTAGTILVAMTGLLLTALKNGSTSIRAASRSGIVQEVAEAREAWQQALLERGILPFLREALASSGSAGAAPGSYSLSRRDPAGSGRTPRLGYSRPGFSSPDDGASGGGDGPRYSSPDFTSPDYGGPDHEPD
ncbi:hypothetical protein G5C51_32130 [Streptomyces sp. A7024]|uniref:Transmembrane protein n=1 Tax=Streptomyces coryli TaxID=1128680 RepID=A0A6G4U8M1_9ACTN|nr:hypothetical protein [Streptomyces coryli]NGN68534.1 hypothetical protein [Streptomyces coryli]